MTAVSLSPRCFLRVVRPALGLAVGMALLTVSNAGANLVNAQSATLAPTMAATVAASTATPTAAPLAGDPVEIGVALALTSNAALFGQDQKIGVELARDYFNYRGGINGRPIKLVLQDSAGDEAGAISAFNTLLGDNQLVGILGPTYSQQAFAADPIADKAGVPVIAALNLAAGIPQIGPFITRVSAPALVVAPTAVKAAIKIDPTIKNVAVLYAQDDAFSKSETGTFQQTVKDLGLNLLPVQTFLTTDRDFTTQATNILSESPDLVVISGLAADSGNLVKQLRELGYKKLIVSGNGLNTPNIFPVCQSACDGIIIAQAYNYSADTAMNNDFRAAFKAAQNGKEPGQVTAQAFSGIQVYIEALRRLDSKTPLAGLKIADLRKALKDEVQSGKYETPLGTITFSLTKKANGDPAGADVNQAQFYIAQVKMSADGKTGQLLFIQ
jgi:branched-chain amino acid transport system substrate-binding protein